MENYKNDKLQKIIQGGAVGLCVALMILLGFIFNRYDKLANNHATEFTNAIKESTKIDQQLISAIESLERTVADLKYMINRQ